MRVLEFPEPRPTDLPRLMPSVHDQLARERKLDGRWIQPLSQVDLEAVASYWRVGSVPRLKRYVNLALRDRDDRQLRHQPGASKCQGSSWSRVHHRRNGSRHGA
jgi:hypothetical protein